MSASEPTASAARPANQRGAARLAAVQALYQMDVGRQTLEDTLSQFNAHMLGREVEGDLRILGNNVSVALCEVWGTVTVEGNNAILVSNRFASAPEVTGQNLICNDDFAFADANDNGVIDEDEVGELIDCDKE